MSVNKALQKYDPSQFNLVLPVTQVEQLPAGTQVSVRVVKVDAKNRDDAYPTENNKMALTKNALQKLSAAAGISWKSIQRTDDRRHPHYCEFEARAVVTDFDGTVREGIGTKTVDLRDDTGNGTPGKDRAAIKSDKQLAKAREFIAEICASKAMNRAVSTTLAIKRSYTEEELKRPFVIPKLIPDTSDPTAQRMVLGSMFGVAGEALYGKPASAEVVDAKLEPTETVEAPPDEEDMAYDPETGEVMQPPPAEPEAAPEPELDRQAVMQRVQKAWNEAKAKGITPDRWRVIMREATGQTGYDGLTPAKLDALDRAVGGAS